MQLSEELLEELPDAARELLAQTRLVVVDCAGVELDPVDLSLGAVSLIPLVAACFDEQNLVQGEVPAGIVAIEEPEAHLHPTACAALGDLFWESSVAQRQGNRKQLLIETHSEHLVLRVLRRVREQATGGSRVKVNPEHLVVLYFGKGELFGKPFPIAVGSDGKFRQPWPDDFFRQDQLERYG